MCQTPRVQRLGALWGQIEPIRIHCTGGYYLSQFYFTFAYGVNLASNLKCLFLLLLKLTLFFFRETHYVPQTGLELTMQPKLASNCNPPVSASQMLRGGINYCAWLVTIFNIILLYGLPCWGKHLAMPHGQRKGLERQRLECNAKRKQEESQREECVGNTPYQLPCVPTKSQTQHIEHNPSAVS